MDAIKAEQAALNRDDIVVDLHPVLANTYRRRVNDLREALNADETARREAGRIPRELIEKVTVAPARPANRPSSNCTAKSPNSPPSQAHRRCRISAWGTWW